VLDAVGAAGRDDTDADDVFHTIRDLRIPVEYLAELFTAGDAGAVSGVLMKLAAMRSYMRARTLDGTVAQDLLDSIAMTGAQVESMYRLLAIAKYDERYVIPAAHRGDAAALQAQAAAQPDCALDCEGGPGMTAEAAVESFHLVAGEHVRPGRPGLFARRGDGRRGLSINPLRGRS
jgi:nitrate reductase beta subunit